MNNRIYESDNRIIFKSAIISCILFLVAHIFYVIFFLITKVYPLVYINIGSSLFYCIQLFLIYKGFKNLYVIMSAVEIGIYLTVGTMFCGNESGFQLCLIALIILVFFAGYFSKGNHNYIKPIRISLFHMALFVFVYIWLKFKEPFTTISDTALTILFVVHMGITFGFVISFLAILTSYTVKLEKRIEKESITDKLTGISNRNGLNEYLGKIGNQKNNYLLAIFDIDNFKKFNDVNGHLCGDYVLKEIARIAKDNSKYDFVSRWGGEEFVILSKIEGSIDDTISKIDRVRDTIYNYDFKYDDKILKSTITIGVASYNNDETIDDWIKRADEKLYQGKHNGKNQTVS